MKKIFLTAISAFLFFAINAQESYAPASAKKMSTEEANKLNGVAQPTINGKPYSQYKAEQDALKKQRESNKTVTVSSDIVNIKDVKPAPARVQQTLRSNDGDGGATPMPVIIEQSVVSGKNTDGPAPEAYKMPAQDQWKTGTTNKTVVETSVGVDPSSKQSPSNVVLPVEIKVSQESKMTRTQPVIQEKESVTKNPDATYTKSKTPESTSQFKPIAPVTKEEKSADNGNSTNGEKPAQVPPAKQQ